MVVIMYTNDQRPTLTIDKHRYQLSSMLRGSSLRIQAMRLFRISRSWYVWKWPGYHDINWHHHLLLQVILHFDLANKNNQHMFHHICSHMFPSHFPNMLQTHLPSAEGLVGPSIHQEGVGVVFLQEAARLRRSWVHHEVLPIVGDGR